MPFIEINGKKIEAEAGAMIIEVADSCNVQIPRFCYHKKLSIAANCRMCLVEVERAPKPLPACATPITEGMKIWTRSPKVLLAQKTVMEFLLINHPLDCPICDQGGECELQDLSMGYGNDASRYVEEKRVVEDKNLGPLIATDLTRCIHCMRCVRFGSEIAGVRELGATGRGEHTEIGTYIEQSVASEVSGNIIDLCPVGAITSKPFRFTARGWELTQTPSIAPHDCIGSNIYVHTRRDKVMRVVPRENEKINEVWVSDRDRFSYEGLYHSDRLLAPKIKQEGVWHTVSWEEALQCAVNGLLQVIAEQSPAEVGAILSPNTTLEESYLLQKWMRGLGSHNIDHRLRQSDFRHQTEAPIFPSLGLPLAELEQQAVVLLVGSNIRKEQPIIALKLRKMTLLGGKVWAVNPLDISFNFAVEFKNVVARGELVLGLARVAKALLQEAKDLSPPGVLEWLQSITPEAMDIAMAKRLMQPGKKLILMGSLGTSHPGFSQLTALAALIADISGAKFGTLTEGSNSAGAWLAGCVPHRLPGGRSVGSAACASVSRSPSKSADADSVSAAASAGPDSASKFAPQTSGLTLSDMLQKRLKAYVLMNVEPHIDCVNGIDAVQALQTAQWVVAITPFENPVLQETADVLLPLALFTETSGTFVNIEGQWQSFRAATKPLAESRPGWEILKTLGRLCGISDCKYDAAQTVLEALKSEIDMGRSVQADMEFGIGMGIESDAKSRQWQCPEALEYLTQGNEIIRIAPVPLYATDGLVRRAKSLQHTPDAGSPAVHINRALANRLRLENAKAVQVKSGDCSIVLPLAIDEAVPDNAAMIFAGIEETVFLGEGYSAVTLAEAKR